MITAVAPEVKASDMQIIRSRYAELIATGECRSNAICILLKEAQTFGCSLSNEEIFGVAGEVISPNPTPPDANLTQVTQEPQETQEPQRDSPRLSEIYRGEASSPCDEKTQTPEEEHTGREAPLYSGDELPRRAAEFSLQDYLTHCGNCLGGRVFAKLLPKWQLVFAFARLMKVHPDCARLTPKKAFATADKAVKSWKQGRGAGTWESWFGVTRADAEVVFLDSWDKIRYLPGQTPLANALELARRQPIQLHDRLKEKRPDSYEEFVSLAGWLQVGMGARPILLPCREVGELLGVSRQTISTFRRWAKEDGFLVEVKESKWTGKRGEGEATMFRFKVQRVPILEETAQKERQS